MLVEFIYATVLVEISLVVYISHEPMIRNHSYLDHTYPVWFVLFPMVQTPGFVPRGGARGQNLCHL